jgi:hypothetical protein
MAPAKDFLALILTSHDTIAIGISKSNGISLQEGYGFPCSIMCVPKWIGASLCR